MTTFTITVTPDDGTAANWMVEYFKYNGPGAPRPSIHLINFADQGDGTFEAQIKLDPRPYGFGINLFGSGKSLKIDMAPARQILFGGGAWPVTLTGSPLQTRDLFVILFDAGVSA